PYVRPDEADRTIAAHESVVQDIIGILREAKGLDFAGYKRNTLNRRIARRMVLHKLDNLREYERLVRSDPREADALFQDVLINVTSFFRNPDAYEALKTKVFPAITEERNRHDPVRIWALGCSTGEEAYSLAIAFTEYLEQSGRRLNAQVFATDANAAGIEKARSGIYAKGISQDVSPERLRRFFLEVDGSYRIAKPIRDMCVFARQNVLSDPPFSRLDLVACRNLLIYLDGSQQQRLMPMLHYALRSGGFLWLGGSETVGTHRELFEMLDVKHKVYSKKEGRKALAASGLPRWTPGAAPLLPSVPRPSSASEAQRSADRLLLARYVPACIVLDADFEILQFRGDTTPYIAPPPGRATLNALKILREGLVAGVRDALARARKEQRVVRVSGLRVRIGGKTRPVDLEVTPVFTQDSPTFLVVFEEPAKAVMARARHIQQEAQASADRSTRSKSTRAAKDEIDRLKDELATTHDYLQSVIEQQEAANEELQSANEEVQSANEELQSINEELETSKEEIQSSNEELSTVNEELQERNLEFAQANNDLNNLLASVQLPIVMLGPDLRIRRFTPAAERLFNLIPGDVGRPVSDVKLNVAAEALESVVAEVLETMATRELEVRDRAGRWHLMRVRPYRTQENVIDGAVIVLVDIDEVKRGEQALREGEARFAVLANSVPVLVWMSDLSGGCQFVNRAFEDFVGASQSGLRGSSISQFVHPDDRAGFDAAFASAAAARKVFEHRARWRRADATYRMMKSVANPRVHGDETAMGYVGGTFDITDLQQAEASLIELDHAKNEFLAMLAHELRNPLAGVRNASRLLEPEAPAQTIARAKEIIDRQSGNMVRMVEELLDISRITQGIIQIRDRPVELGATVRAAIDSTAADRD
ncbi:MAG TPA: CheR family methyltransferase, partial [Usitatibacter sp.]|nr:CheR family methyltransferase [Usitatibacter sp.]